MKMDLINNACQMLCYAMITKAQRPDLLRIRLLPDNLTQVLRSVALVGRDDNIAGELRVPVSRVYDLLELVVDDGEGGEALAGPELARPVAGDGVDAARLAVDRGVGGVVAGDGVAARRHGGGVRVDVEGVFARGVGRVAHALELGDGPLGGGGDHH